MSAKFWNMFYFHSSLVVDFKSKWILRSCMRKFFHKAIDLMQRWVRNHVHEDTYGLSCPGSGVFYKNIRRGVPLFLFWTSTKPLVQRDWAFMFNTHECTKFCHINIYVIRSSTMPNLILQWCWRVLKLASELKDFIVLWEPGQESGWKRLQKHMWKICVVRLEWWVLWYPVKNWYLKG